MINLSAEAEKSLQEAFESAKSQSENFPFVILAVDTDGAWEKSETEFNSNEHDVSLQFDYNKNPAEVPPAQEAQLRFVMQIVQQQGTNGLANAGQDFTKDSDVWIEFFAKYPLLFNFQSRKSKILDSNDFTLSVNSDLVTTCIDVNAPADIKSAFIQALQSSSGEVLSTTQKKEKLEYLALIRSYDKASTLTIYKAELRMEVTQVKTLCGGVEKVNLHIAYDEVVFEINNQLALAIYPELSKEAADIAVQYLSEFFKKFAEQEFRDFETWLDSLGR
jgi:hypothetical protein